MIKVEIHMKKILILLIFTGITTMIVAQVSKTIQVVTAGSLYSVLTNTEKNSITNLTVSGNLDARDFVTMRDSMPALTVLDLSGSVINSYSGSGGSGDSSNAYSNVSNTYAANELPKAAFYNLISWEGKTSLTSVIMPSSITSIGDDAFESCIGLTSISIPASDTAIGNNAFNSCIGLTKIAIPDKVHSIGLYAFAGCNNVKSIYTYSSIPISFNSTDLVFYNNTFDSCILFVPIGSKTAYQAAMLWKRFKYIVEMGGLSLSSNTVSTSSNQGSSASVYINCDTSWTAVCNESWLKLNTYAADKGGQFLTVSDSANSTNNSRTAIVTITAKGYPSQTITIVQDAAVVSQTPTLSVSSNTVTLAKTVASTATINVNSNTTWVASSNQSWLLVSPNTQTTGNATLTFTALANTGLERSATVTILTTGITKTINVIQETGLESSIKNIDNDRIAIYPNPAHSSITIKSEDPAKVELYTITGALILSTSVSDIETIPIGNISGGFYLIKIITNKGIITKCLIVE